MSSESTPLSDNIAEWTNRENGSILLSCSDLRAKIVIFCTKNIQFCYLIRRFRLLSYPRVVYKTPVLIILLLYMLLDWRPAGAQ